jgi:hypothetical protein
MGLDEALYGVLDDLVRIVDEPLHGVSCKMPERGAQRIV